MRDTRRPRRRQTDDRGGYTRSVTDDHDDRRRAERVSVNAPFEADSGTPAWVRDLSERGVFLQTRQRAPIGAEVSMQFTVLLDDPVSIRANGRVVRHQDDPSGMGIEFTDLDPVMVLRINDAVSRERPRDSGPPLPGDDYAATIVAPGKSAPMRARDVELSVLSPERNGNVTAPDSGEDSVDEAAQTLVNLRSVDAEIIEDEDLPMDDDR